MSGIISYIPDTSYSDQSSDLVYAQALASVSLEKIVPFTHTQNGSEVVKQLSTTPSSITLCAHTDPGQPPTKIGDRTPEELAKDFSTMIGSTNKKKVTDIYLISCEAGVGAPSLAQKLATAMKNQGFDKVKIHAVAHPKGLLIGGGVEVTAKEGLATGGKFRTKGQVVGYFYGDTASKEYDEYIKIASKIASMSRKDRTESETKRYTELKSKYGTYDKKKVIIIDLVTDISEMDEPYNTFGKSGPQTDLSADVAIAIDFFKGQKETLQKFATRPQKTIDELDALIKKLKTNSMWTSKDINSELDTILARHSGWLSKTNTNFTAYKTELNARLKSINNFSQSPALLSASSDTRSYQRIATSSPSPVAPQTATKAPTDPNFFFAWLKSLLAAIVKFCKWAMGSEEKMMAPKVS